MGLSLTSEGFGKVWNFSYLILVQGLSSIFDLVTPSSMIGGIYIAHVRYLGIGAIDFFPKPLLQVHI